jgi:hypothetical protein
MMPRRVKGKVRTCKAKENYSANPVGKINQREINELR